MLDNPLISVIMPTYNSQNTIELVFQSIKKQSYKNYEILVIDGGSSDLTLSIAKKYGACILENKYKLPEYAKHIGLLKARGKYAVFLDSDEVILDEKSWEKKINFLKKGNFQVKNFVTAGLLNPQGYTWINSYINKIGDPFSFWLYGIQGDSFKKSMLDNYNLLAKDGDVLVFEFLPKDLPPICDGGGHFFDLSYLKTIADINDISIVTRVFKLMESQTHQLALLDNDYIEHFSTASFSVYLNKINWRIINNIHYADTKLAGYINREKGGSFFVSCKKYLFIPYSLSIIFPLITSIVLMIQTKEWKYLYHVYFSFYTGGKILQEYIKKIIGWKTLIPLYGK